MFCDTPFICERECVNFPSLRFSNVFSRSSAAFSKNVRRPAFTGSEPDFIAVLQGEVSGDEPPGRGGMGVWVGVYKWTGVQRLDLSPPLVLSDDMH